MAQKPKSQSINQNFDSLLKEKKQKNKKDTSKLDSRGFKMDTGKIFFWKIRIISLSRRKPIGSALKSGGA